jgi:hypothetical protein
MDSDVPMIVAMVLSAMWLAPAFSRVVVLRDTVRDDFGYVIPYHQEMMRRQTVELLLRLFFVVIALAVIVNWPQLVDRVNEWVNTR